MNADSRARGTDWISRNGAPESALLTSARSPALRILVCVLKFAIQASEANNIVAET